MRNFRMTFYYFPNLYDVCFMQNVYNTAINYFVMFVYVQLYILKCVIMICRL